MDKTDFIQAMKATMIKYHMIDRGDRVIIGLSGGADSMALFHALRSVKEEYALWLAAVHVNHGLRDAEARQDEAFVREVCAAHNVELSVYHFDIQAVAKENALTLEEAGRLKRYEAFDAALTVYGAQKIAVAHHLNDQAETVLMRLIRGTGTKGLAGIPAVRGHIIRPLIERSREEIEKFMAENGYCYRTDSTNLADAYARNKIRLKLIPYIKTELNPNVIRSLARTAMISAEENDYIESEAANAYGNCAENGNIRISALNELPPVIQKRVLRKACMAAAESLKDITYEHISDLLQLAANTTGKKLHLPYGLTVENSYGYLLFSKKTEAPPESFCYAIPPDGTGNAPLYIREAGLYLTASVDTIKNLGNLNNTCTKRFDCDKIVGTLSLRSPRQGDRILLNDHGSKKISRYFIDAKIPGRDRQKVPLLADDNFVLWIIGRSVSKKHEAEQTSSKTITIQLWEEQK